MPIIPKDLSDIELLRLCFSKDIALGNQAMQLFNTRYQARTINRAIRYGFPRADAPSIYHEVFMRVAEKYQDAIPNPNLEAYFFKTLKNVYSESCKDAKKRDKIVTSIGYDESEDPAKDAEQMSVFYENTLKIQQVLAEMKPNDAFLLNNLEMPRKELAEKLKISENYCKVQMNRAKEKCKKIWEKKFGKYTSW